MLYSTSDWDIIRVKKYTHTKKSNMKDSANVEIRRNIIRTLPFNFHSVNNSGKYLPQIYRTNGIGGILVFTFLESPMQPASVKYIVCGNYISRETQQSFLFSRHLAVLILWLDNPSSLVHGGKKWNHCKIIIGTNVERFRLKLKNWKSVWKYKVWNRISKMWWREKNKREDETKWYQKTLLVKSDIELSKF